MKKDKYKEIIKNLISVGIEFKMHKNYPVIYCKQKIDPQILEIAKNNRAVSYTHLTLPTKA